MFRSEAFVVDWVIPWRNVNLISTYKGWVLEKLYVRKEKDENNWNVEIKMNVMAIHAKIYLNINS